MESVLGGHYIVTLIHPNVESFLGVYRHRIVFLPNKGTVRCKNTKSCFRLFYFNFLFIQVYFSCCLYPKGTSIRVTESFRSLRYQSTVTTRTTCSTNYFLLCRFPSMLELIILTFQIVFLFTFIWVPNPPSQD